MILRSLFHSYSNCPATGMLIGPLPVCLVLNDVANKITGPILVWTKVLWLGDDKLLLGLLELLYYHMLDLHLMKYNP